MSLGDNEKISVRNGHGGRKMIGFILGSIFGGTAGVLAMCFYRVASEVDKCMNQTDSED